MVFYCKLHSEIKPIVGHPNSHVKSAWHLLTSLIILRKSQGNNFDFLALVALSTMPSIPDLRYLTIQRTNICLQIPK